MIGDEKKVLGAVSVQCAYHIDCLVYQYDPQYQNCESCLLVYWSNKNKRIKKIRKHLEGES